jgi:hypothetical protein
MICETCLRGAEYNRMWRKSGHPAYLTAAEAAHGQCFSSCGCQHSVGVDSLTVIPSVP